MVGMMQDSSSVQNVFSSIPWKLSSAATNRLFSRFLECGLLYCFSGLGLLLGICISLLVL